jgi:murein DD-endopeptidase MepM/ murein hydrolase activator NlpD
VSGCVVAINDGISEPKRLNLLLDLFKVIWNSVSVSFKTMFIPRSDINLERYIGNYIIIKFDGTYAFLTHIRPNSICVKEGQSVNSGDLIGLVGHTGNSTAPHLHFHLMDSPDLMAARGVPCSFNKYEILINGKWQPVENEMPKSSQRIRYI